MKLLVISNPVAGRNSGDKTKKVVSYLSSCGADVSVEYTSFRGNATNIAAEAYSRGIEKIVAVAGDGTINEIINGIVGIDIALGIIPAGTTNVFAREVHIPDNAHKACDIILKGNERRVSLGVINGSYFMLMASAGFDAEVVNSIDLKLKAKTGKFAYISSALKVSAQYEFPAMSIITDQKERYEGCLVVVSNVRYYAGKFVMAPYASTDDKFLDVCIFTKKGKRQLARYLWGILTKSHHKYKDVIYLKARQIRIFSERKINVQVDGDPFCELPVDISVVPKVLRVCCP
ncbi:MAG: diacylglycerol kinase family lipid kinase [bacterium]|nr:diacylglycerol kinase family lipid kinase [bacterium]